MKHAIILDNHLSCFIASAIEPAAILDIRQFVEELLKDSR